MNNFTEVPASKGSISKRKLVYGVGVNDAKYTTSQIINGKRTICPFYRKWSSMINRCYSQKYKARYPTYMECAVCDEWLTFSNFKVWMKTQSWNGMHLDKDIIEPGNKIYSPSRCRFITSKLNNLLLDRAAARGRLPQGVCFHKGTGKFTAQLNANGKLNNLGIFSTPEEASAVYIKEKTKLILKVANEQTDSSIAKGLRLHAELLKETNAHWRMTK